MLDAPLEFRNDLQVVEHFMFGAAPLGQSQWMSQQRLAAVGRVTYSQRHASK